MWYAIVHVCMYTVHVEMHVRRLHSPHYWNVLAYTVSVILDSTCTLYIHIYTLLGGHIHFHFCPLLSSLPTPLPFHVSLCFQHRTVYVYVSVVMYSYIHLQVLVFKVVTYSIIYGVSVFVSTCMVQVLCVVSMCCNSCPFITLPLLVLLHKSCVPHQLTHDAHNMTYAQYYYLSTLWPFFPLLLIYFNDLQLPTITYQHRIAQYLHT